MAMNYGLLSQTAHYSKNPHPVLYHLTGKLFGLSNLGIYFMAYAYGKWIDDQIDSLWLKSEDGQKILERQRRIMAGGLIPENVPEKIGAYLGAYFKDKDANMLGKWYSQFLHSFDLDIERKYNIITKDKLQERMFVLGSSFINFCQGILAPSEVLNETFVAHTIKAYIQLDMLLDLEDDLKVGYCNIPFESLENTFRHPHEIFNNSFPDIKIYLGPYVRDTIIDIRSAMKEALPMIQSVRSLTFRFFLKKMYKKRLHKLERLDLDWKER